MEVIITVLSYQLGVIKAVIIIWFPVGSFTEGEMCQLLILNQAESKG